jgi:hypothetical protein
LASLHRDPKSKTFRVMFRYGGKQYQKSLKTTDQAEAEALKGKIEVTLLELERGRKTLPSDADLWQFVISDGQRTQKTQAPTVFTLDGLFSRYEEEMPPGTLEANTLETYRLHKKHLLRLLPKRAAVQTITTTEVQK